MIKAVKAPGFYENVVWCPPAKLCLETDYQSKQGHVLCSSAGLGFPCAQPKLEFVLHNTLPCSWGVWLSTPRPRELPRSETPPYSHQSHNDGRDTLGSRHPQRFTSPLCNFRMQNVSVCYGFAEKSMRLPSAQGSEMPWCCKSPLETYFYFNAEGTGGGLSSWLSCLIWIPKVRLKLLYFRLEWECKRLIWWRNGKIRPELAL